MMYFTKNLILSFLVTSFVFADENTINSTNTRDCEEFTNVEDCYASGCEWTTQITPNGFFEVCVDPEFMDDGGWEDGDNESDYECDSVDNPFECIALGCDWNQEEGCTYSEESEDDGDEELICQDIDNLYECFALGCDWMAGNMPGAGYCTDGGGDQGGDDGDWNDDGGDFEGCFGLSQDECSEVEGCDWISGFAGWTCVDINGNDGGWNDDGGWDECRELPQDICTVLPFCEWTEDGCIYAEPGGDDGDWNDDGGDFEGCFGLSQDECSEVEGCDWMSNDPTGAFGVCVDSGSMDDGGWDDDCNPDLMCATVITCVDGLLYPTACGPENCDDPIGECDGEENGIPGCILDCPGIDFIDDLDGMAFCDWVLTIVAPSGCFEDCEQEVLDEIEETMIICDECLPENTCDDYFNDQEPDNNCIELSLDECRETNGCEPNFNADGEFEGCYESNDVDDGCMSETGEYYCVGCEWFIGECDYYECTNNGWEGPFTQDECGEDDDGGAGDGGWLDCSSFSYEECMSNPDCEWYLNNNMDVGYCDDISDDFQTQLSLADSQALPGTNVIIPMFLTSDDFVGGVQFTISTTMSLCLTS